MCDGLKMVIYNPSNLTTFHKCARRIREENISRVRTLIYAWIVWRSNTWKTFIIITSDQCYLYKYYRRKRNQTALVTFKKLSHTLFVNYEIWLIYYTYMYIYVEFHYCATKLLINIFNVVIDLFKIIFFVGYTFYL